MFRSRASCFQVGVAASTLLFDAAKCMADLPAAGEKLCKIAGGTVATACDVVFHQHPAMMDGHSEIEVPCQPVLACLSALGDSHNIIGSHSLTRCCR